MSLHKVGFKNRTVDLFESASYANFDAFEVLIIDKILEKRSNYRFKSELPLMVYAFYKF